MDCNLIIFNTQVEIIQNIKCSCQQSFIESLKIKLSSGHGFEKFPEQAENIITNEMQEDMSTAVDDRLNKLSILSQNPGQSVDLSHMEMKYRLPMEQLIAKYDNAFAAHRMDTSNFNGFRGVIEVKEGETCLEKERPVRPHVRDEVQTMVDELLAEGIIRRADFQGPFCSNSPQ